MYKHAAWENIKIPDIGGGDCHFRTSHISWRRLNIVNYISAKSCSTSIFCVNCSRNISIFYSCTTTSSSTMKFRKSIFIIQIPSEIIFPDRIPSHRVSGKTPNSDFVLPPNGMSHNIILRDTS